MGPAPLCAPSVVLPGRGPASLSVVRATGGSSARSTLNGQRIDSKGAYKKSNFYLAPSNPFPSLKNDQKFQHAAGNEFLL